MSIKYMFVTFIIFLFLFLALFRNEKIIEENFFLRLKENYSDYDSGSEDLGYESDDESENDESVPGESISPAVASTPTTGNTQSTLTTDNTQPTLTTDNTQSTLTTDNTQSTLTTDNILSPVEDEVIRYFKNKTYKLEEILKILGVNGNCRSFQFNSPEWKICHDSKCGCNEQECDCQNPPCYHPDPDRILRMGNTEINPFLNKSHFTCDNEKSNKKGLLGKKMSCAEIDGRKRKKMWVCNTNIKIDVNQENPSDYIVDAEQHARKIWKIKEKIVQVASSDEDELCDCACPSEKNDWCYGEIKQDGSCEIDEKKWCSSPSGCSFRTASQGT